MKRVKMFLPLLIIAVLALVSSCKKDEMIEPSAMFIKAGELERLAAMPMAEYGKSTKSASAFTVSAAPLADYVE